MTCEKCGNLSNFVHEDRTPRCLVCDIHECEARLVEMQNSCIAVNEQLRDQYELIRKVAVKLFSDGEISRHALAYELIGGLPV